MLLLLCLAAIISATAGTGVLPGFGDLCLWPFCTETTTTTTDIVTLATVVNLTTTLTVSQPVVVCLTESSLTVTASTSTCTAACTTILPPHKRYQLCRYSNGPFRVLFNTLDFVGGLEACESFGWHMADLTYGNFNDAVQVEQTCLGQDRRAWVRSYDGDAKPCLALNSGDTSKAQRAMLEVVPCNLTYPVVCQLPGMYPHPHHHHDHA